MIVKRSTRFYASELELGDCIEISKDFFIDILTEEVSEEETEDTLDSSYEVIRKIRLKKKFLKKKNFADINIKGISGDNQDPEDQTSDLEADYAIAEEGTTPNSDFKEVDLLGLSNPEASPLDERPQINEDEQKAIDDIIASSSDDSGDSDSDSSSSSGQDE